MKIGNPASGIQEQAPPAPAATGRAATDEATKTVPGGVADSSAKVEISGTAANLLAGAKGAPAEFDAGKVTRISEAVADGTFKVNPEAIADKLIANAQEVLGNVKR
jgi:negative regulator of flagellin synthesis FlgM